MQRGGWVPSLSGCMRVLWLAVCTRGDIDMAHDVGPDYRNWGCGSQKDRQAPPWWPRQLSHETR